MDISQLLPDLGGWCFKFQGSINPEERMLLPSVNSVLPNPIWRHPRWLNVHFFLQMHVGSTYFEIDWMLRVVVQIEPPTIARHVHSLVPTGFSFTTLSVCISTKAQVLFKCKLIFQFMKAFW